MLISNDGRALLAVLGLAFASASGCADAGLSVLEPLSRVDPPERAIAIWSAEHHAPSAHCAEHARSARFEVMPPEMLASVCEVSPNAVAGCVYRYDTSGADIALADTPEGEDPLTRLHELLHVLIQCETALADGDSRHRDAVWRHVGQDPT